jgi:mRNA interferase RelE/StbE
LEGDPRRSGSVGWDSLPSFQVLFTSSAEREFRALPREIQERFASTFELLRENATQGRPGCDVRRLSGIAAAWRLRVGDYRGIYALVGEEIIFTRFGHRSTVYDG